MTYSEKYYHEYYDRGNYLNRVELHKLDYTGDISKIKSSFGTPVSIRHTGDLKSFDNDVIQGREMVFNFFCHKADFDRYDEIFESEYKDWLIKWYVSGIQKFEGYV
ncbi:MAG: hypothetical protein U9R01_01380, partial [candidate division WOR-3 bacterium]|nr:hypothetical protein [candidate division WOR-3 bacterium]